MKELAELIILLNLESEIVIHISLDVLDWVEIDMYFSLVFLCVLHMYIP